MGAMPPLSKEQRIARHKDFLRANWRALASFAWGHFLADGKGCVVALEADFVNAASPQYAPIRLKYLAESRRDEMAAAGVTLSDKEDGWLKAYDPAEKVIVMILRGDGGQISSYLLGGSPKPEDCWAADKAKEN